MKRSSSPEKKQSGTAPEDRVDSGLQTTKQVYPAWKSKSMQAVDHAIQLAGACCSTVILRGENGTGKDRIAAIIHNASSRAAEPFVKFSFALLSETELTGELWGDEKHLGQRSVLARGHGGTIFLDDIDRMPLKLQAKFTRVLQEKQFQTPDGGCRAVDARWIIATSSNLEAMVRHGKFREDLYYQLNVIPIFLPPLRHRKEDFHLLAQYFLERFNHANSRKIRQISDSALNSLMEYAWPGNIPEFENALERACILCTGETLAREHFHNLDKNTPFAPGSPVFQDSESSLGHSSEKVKLPQAVERMEMQMIQSALLRAGGIQRKASQMLGITERMLGYKLKLYGLK